MLVPCYPPSYFENINFDFTTNRNSFENGNDFVVPTNLNFHELQYPPPIQSPGYCLSDDGDSHMGDPNHQSLEAPQSQLALPNTAPTPEPNVSHHTVNDFSQRFGGCYINPPVTPNGLSQYGCPSQCCEKYGNTTIRIRDMWQISYMVTYIDRYNVVHGYVYTIFSPGYARARSDVYLIRVFCIIVIFNIAI